MNKEYITLTALFLGQGLTGSIISLLTLTSTLAGNMLSPVSYLTTLPVTATVLGAALMVYYASFLMSRYGRRTAFAIGSLIGLAGSILAITAIFYHSFALFVFSTFIIGGATVFNQYYRFAAAEVFDSESMKKRCTSFIIGGGILGGVLGPFLATQGAYQFSNHVFLGTFLISASVFVLTLLTQMFIILPKSEMVVKGKNSSDSDTGSNLYRHTIRSNDFIIGTLSCALGFAVMTLLMNSAPLAMHHAHFDINQSAVVLQWHFFAMYAPALLLPFILSKLSTFNLIALGALLFLVGVLVALCLDASMGYLISLIAVGIGWSFMFSGGTFLINRCSLPEVKHKVQGLNSSMTYLCNLVASFSVGMFMINERGWWVVNAMSGLIMIIFLIYLMKGRMIKKQ